MRVAAVVPNWNGRRWLPGCLAALRAQTRAFDRLVVVDGGSVDGSVELLRAEHPDVEVLALPKNLGFAGAANRGIWAANDVDAVALVNTDVVLAEDWLARALGALQQPGVGSVATKLVTLADPRVVDDAGDVLRRDGACEQRGRGRRDDGRWDDPGEVWGACAGAALYRRDALSEAGGFDERFFAYMEDVDLALRLRMAGWTCWYEPAVAHHAGQGSSAQLRRSVAGWTARNTLLLVVKAFPVRWWPMVAYRQASWLAHAAREGRLAGHLAGVAAALPHLPAMVRARRALRAAATVDVVTAVPKRPWRGPTAGGHPRSDW